MMAFHDGSQSTDCTHVASSRDPLPRVPSLLGRDNSSHFTLYVTYEHAFSYHKHGVFRLQQTVTTFFFIGQTLENDKQKQPGRPTLSSANAITIFSITTFDGSTIYRGIDKVCRQFRDRQAHLSATFGRPLPASSVRGCYRHGLDGLADVQVCMLG
jgi:hypothetical protein